jgi:hypothetical protein
MSDRNLPIEMRTRMALEDTRAKRDREERERRRIEDAIAFGRKPSMTPYDKFRRIKPTGSRDGYDP